MARHALVDKQGKIHAIVDWDGKEPLTHDLKLKPLPCPDDTLAEGDQYVTPADVADDTDSEPA